MSKLEVKLAKGRKEKKEVGLCTFTCVYIDAYVRIIYVDMYTDINT